MIRSRGTIFLVLLLVLPVFAAQNEISGSVNTPAALRHLVRDILLDNMDIKSQLTTNNADFLDQSQLQNNQITLGKDQYEKYAKAGIFSDVTYLHKKLPGVVSAGDYDSRLYIRGGQSGETATYLDGQLIFMPYIWDGRASLVNPQLINSVTFYTSTFPMKYSGLLSGVLDIKQRTGNKEKYGMELDLNLTEVKFLLEGPIIRNEHSLLYSLRKSYYDYIFKAPNTVYPHLEEYGQKYSFSLGKRHELQLNMNYYSDLMEINDLNINQGIKGKHSSGSIRKMFAINLNSQWSESLASCVNLGYDDADMIWKTEYNNSSYGVALNNKPLNLNADFIFKGNTRNIISTGLELRKELFVYQEENKNRIPYIEYPGSMPLTDSGNYTAGYQTYALYLQDDLYIVPDRVKLNIGTRYSWVNDSNLSNSKLFQPCLSLRMLDNGGTLTFFMSYEHHGAFDIPVYQGSLQNTYPERLTQYTIGMEQQVSRDVTWKAETFYKKYDSLIFPIRNSYTGEITGYDNTRTGKAVGLEFYLERKEHKDWAGWISYTYAIAQYKDPDTDWYYADQDQLQTLNLVGYCRLNKDWNFVLNWTISTGKPYTNITGATYDATRNVYVPITGPTNVERLPGYNNLSITLENSHLFWPFDGFTGSYYIGIVNLFNQNNIYGYSWNDSFTQRTEIRMLPLLPVFGLKIQL